MEFSHYSVLLQETIDELHIRPDGIYVDGTLGGGGHAFQVCSRLNENGHFYGIDQDAAAIEAAGERLRCFGNQVTIIRSNYCRMVEELKTRGVTGVDGIVLDLGVSSYQLDEADRGFTYREDAALDMRMDQRQEKTARDIVNGYSEMELYRVIRDYGEDKFAKNIAKHIVQAREKKPVETTGELVEIIKAAIPAKIRMQKGHPAFQKELESEFKIRRSSVTSVIQGLEKHGLVERRSVSTDARQKELVLTEEGVRVQRQVIERIEEMEKRVNGWLSPEEREWWLRCVNKIETGLKEAEYD